MRKILSLRIAACLFTLLAGIGLLSPQAANAQTAPQIARTVPLYRFLVPDATYGYFLTPDFNEGVSRGYIFNAEVGSIVIPPGPGWTPAPGQGLAPMHRWRVNHRAGTNYYYSAGLYQSITSNPENTYEGLMGYALVPQSEFLGGYSRAPLHLWYSTTNGYFYGLWSGLTEPAFFSPGPSYNWQGVAYILPGPQTLSGTGGCGPLENCFLFNPPPAAPVCDGDQEQACYANGGAWDSNSCSCSYLQPPDPLPECQPGMICAAQPY